MLATMKAKRVWIIVAIVVASLALVFGVIVTWSLIEAQNRAAAQVEYLACIEATGWSRDQVTSANIEEFLVETEHCSS